MSGNSVFKDLKVLDFSTSLVGPGASRLLADYGATVVKVESATHLDVLRTNRPFAGGKPGVNRSGYFAIYNSGKYSLCLNMNKPETVTVTDKLINWADILIESFRPGIMEKWKLAYADVRKIKRDIIMVSTTMLGQYGPDSGFRGYGHHGAALAGWGSTIGWPDREPVLPFGAYTDYISLRYVVAAVIGALEYRRRTGQGQYIDNSQVECSIGLEAPSVLDYSANHHLMKPQGNRDSNAVPHGAFRCLGNDRWVAIAITDDKEWIGFCQLVGETGWTKDPRFATLLDRKKNENELEQLVEKWTGQRDCLEIVDLLQSNGIAASVVESAADMHSDPQLQHRGHFKVFEHPEMGPVNYENFGFRLSKTPGSPRFADPCLGQHNDYVCHHLLGMSDEEFMKLLEKGVFE